MESRASMYSISRRFIVAGLHDQRRSKHDELGTVLDEGLKLLAGKKIKPLGECPDPETFVRFVQGQVDAETQKSINSHIAFCDECYREYLALANPEDIRTPHED